MGTIADVSALIRAREGKNSYTQSYLRDRVFEGYSDCSSLVWKCFERGMGTFIGTWTGQQIDKGTLVFLNRDASKKGLVQGDLAKMREGDLVFWGPSRYDSRHVEYYMGNGQLSGHGFGIGPVRKSATSYRHSYQLLEVRRYASGGTSTGGSAQGGTTAAGTNSDPTEKKRLFVGQSVADDVNVRTWAGIQYANIKSWPKLNYGNQVEVMDYTQKDIDGADWYYVRIAQKYYGFVRSDLITKA